LEQSNDSTTCPELDPNATFSLFSFVHTGSYSTTPGQTASSSHPNSPYTFPIDIHLLTTASIQAIDMYVAGMYDRFCIP
jgi:hypothetical protein